MSEDHHRNEAKDPQAVKLTDAISFGDPDPDDDPADPTGDPLPVGDISGPTSPVAAQREAEVLEALKERRAHEAANEAAGDVDFLSGDGSDD